jgi:hypothetical protein
MTRRVPPEIETDTPIGPDVDLETEIVRDQAYADRVVEATRKTGRPSLAHGRSPSIAFRLPEKLREQAHALATRKGKTVSELAREAFEDLVRRSS